MRGVTHHRRRYPRSAREVEPMCSGPSLPVRPGGQQKVWRGDCGGSRPQGWESFDLLRDTFRSAPDTKSD